MILNANILAGAGGGGDITTGLVGWWKLDDNTGTTAVNDGSAGGAANGTLSGGTIPTWVAPGKIGVAMLNFGGVGYVNIPNTSPTNTPTDFTISAWVKISSVPNAYQTIYSTNAGTNYRQIFVKSNGKIAVYMYGISPGNYDGTGSITLSAGNWYFICLTVSSTTGTLFCSVNDVMDKSFSFTGTIGTASPNPISIGTDLNNANRQWRGDIDDVRLYNRVLTSQDITTLYNYT